MERYEDKIEKALQYLKSPSRTDARGVSPIVYLVYKPEDAIIASANDGLETAITNYNHLE